MHRFSQSYLVRNWHLPALVGLATVATAAGALAIDPLILVDEHTLIKPAIGYISGEILTDVQYPSFPFYFYGFFFKASYP